MKQSVLIILIISLVTVIQLLGKDSTPPANMSAYLPQVEDLKEWVPADTPQHVVGDDLFLLINGGAEIYHEYGFKQAITQGFKNKTQPSLGFNLEIYEMQNPTAAYGIYTFKTGDSGKPVNVGNQGLLEEYYINSWKGNFLVTVIGFNADKETLKGILLAAKTVTAKIKETGQLPELLQILPKYHEYQVKPNGITYLKGNLALFNQYDFDSKDIFGLKEGLMADYGDFRLFIFQYNDVPECRERFQGARDYLQINPRYKDFNITGTGLSFLDDKNNPFYMQMQKRCVLITQGKNKEEAQAIIEKVNVH